MQLQFTWLRAISAYIVLMFPVAAFATVINVGQIEAEQTWSLAKSPYLITEDVTRTSPLTIEPGVQVQFAGSYTLTIASTLIAGTPRSAHCASGEEVVFTVPPGGAPVAAKLMFTGGDAVFDTGGAYQSGSILECVIVENIGGANTSGAVVLFGARPISTTVPFAITAPAVFTRTTLMASCVSKTAYLKTTARCSVAGYLLQTFRAQICCCAEIP